MKIIPFVAEALGDASYLVVDSGAAAVIDPQRDVRPYLAAAAEHDAEIRFVFETHVHNDYLSGGRELAALGATVVAPKLGLFEFPHLAVGDSDEIAVGGALLRAVAAPGHTYEHLAYVAVSAEGAIEAAFTGGAILMGSAGRSDLLGPDHSEELTRMQWETGQRLGALLPANAQVMPTHGAGSFCSVTGTALERQAPLSVERDRNPLFISGSYEAFRAIQFGTPAPVPGYYRYMAPINRRGAEVYGERAPLATIALAGVQREMRGGALFVDIRRRADHAAGHMPGTLGIEDSTSFLAYIGWLVPFNEPLVLVSEGLEHAERVRTDLFRIGYEQVRGYFPHAAWVGGGMPVERIPRISVAEIASLLSRPEIQVLDVRYAREHEQSPLPGAKALSIDAIEAWAPELPPGPLAIVCASGQRALMAASYLQSFERDVAALDGGGAEDVLAQLRAG